MTTKSYRISDNLFLVQQSVAKDAPKAAAAVIPTNHILVSDCSGSMYGAIDQIRQQIKNKLPTLIGEQDTLTLIWFSGRGDFGVIIEAEPIRTMKDLSKVHAAIDSGLRARGLTGFKDPIEEVGRVVGRVSKARPDSVFSLCFMSDGCDNVWPRADVLKAVEGACKGLASATFVEYGYYADRPLLTAMAERAGGNLIFAQAFDSYMPQIEAVLNKRPTGAKRVSVKVEGDPVCGFVYTLSNGELTTYAVEGGAVNVPEDMTEVFYLAPAHVSGTLGESMAARASRLALSIGSAPAKAEELAPLYAALSLFSVRMQPNIVYPILKALGDVRLIESFSSCFGKQKYSEFMDATKAAAFDAKLQFTAGYDPNKVPRDDAYTVLDVLRLLASDDNNTVLLDHEAFKYAPIGRGRVDASEQLTKEEQAELDGLMDDLKKAGKNAKKLKEVNEKIASLTNKPAALKFEATPVPNGYSIGRLVFDEDRPNVSFMVTKQGTVDISSRLPEAFKGSKLGAVPEKIETQIFRNYAVIKDGLVNVERLPVKVSGPTLVKLKEEGVISDVTADGVVILDLKALPVINRKMIKAASAKDLFELEFALTVARADQKVYNSLHKELTADKTKVDQTYEALYGADAALWLKEQGFTERSGFAPKSVQAEATDFYMGKALQVKLKGYSSIPSLNDFKKQADKGKYNGPGELMKPAYEAFQKEAAVPFDSEDARKAHLVAFLEKKQKESTALVRELLFKMSQIKSAVVIGQVWFTEFSSVDENTMTLKVKTPAGVEVEIHGTVVMSEVEIKI